MLTLLFCPYLCPVWEAAVLYRLLCCTRLWCESQPPCICFQRITVPAHQQPACELLLPLHLRSSNLHQKTSFSFEALQASACLTTYA